MATNDEVAVSSGDDGNHDIARQDQSDQNNNAPTATEANQTSPDETVAHQKEMLADSNDGRSGASSHEGVEGVATEKEADKASQDGKINGRSKGKITIIMLALCLAVFLAALDVTIITTALPTISEHFHTASGYTWIGSAFLLANAASTPSWAKISDIFGRKPMLLAANVIFLIGSLVAALSNSIGMLIAARVVQGIGAGGLVVLVNIIIGDLFPLRIRGGFYGLVGATWAIASSIGPIIGGVLTQKASWRWCFYINLPIDGVAFLILVFFLDVKTPRTPIIEGLKAVDWMGTILVVGGTLMFLFGLQYGGITAPWDSAMVLCLIIIGVFTFALFLTWEWKVAKRPVMPFSIFSSKTNCATLACVFVHGVVFISGSYYLPLYFQAVRGATPILSGVYLLPTAVSIGLSSIVTGIFVGKSGQYLPPIYAGFFFMTLGYGLFVDYHAHSSWAKLIIYQIIAAIGIGPLFQAPIVALQAHIPPRDIGTATAALGFTRSLATSIGVVIGDVVYQNQFSKKTPQLATVLSPQQAAQLSGGSAGASTQLIDQLPEPQKNAVRVAFANSLRPMWIMFCCISFAGIVAMIFIHRKKLTRDHEETKTGLEAEKANAEARAAEKEAKRQAKLTGKAKGPVSERLDPEKEHDLESGVKSKPV